MNSVRNTNHWKCIKCWIWCICICWQHAAPNTYIKNLTSYLYSMIRTHNLYFVIRFWPISALISKTLHRSRIWCSVFSVISVHKENILGKWGHIGTNLAKNVETEASHLRKNSSRLNRAQCFFLLKAFVPLFQRRKLRRVFLGKRRRIIKLLNLQMKAWPSDLSRVQ